MAKLAYAETAAKQVFGQHPADLLLGTWIPAWVPALYALDAAGAAADVVATACGRLEFLGALYVGETGDTKSVHFVEFCARFLEPLDPGWKQVHNISGAGHSASELHGSFRTRALGGAEPPPHTLANPERGVVAFALVREPEARERHLKLADGAFTIHVPAFLGEVVASFASYAAYLREDRETIAGSPLKPVERFRRGLWWRLRPSGLATKVWAAEGAARKIPA